MSKGIGIMAPSLILKIDPFILMKYYEVDIDDDIWTRVTVEGNGLISYLPQLLFIVVLFDVSGGAVFMSSLFGRSPAC